MKTTGRNLRICHVLLQLRDFALSVSVIAKRQYLAIFTKKRHVMPEPLACRELRELGRILKWLDDSTLPEPLELWKQPQPMAVRIAA